MKYSIPKCECCDKGCRTHREINHCENQSICILYRIDMDDRTGTAFCGQCADDALESGLFSCYKRGKA